MRALIVSSRRPLGISLDAANFTHDCFKDPLRGAFLFCDLDDVTDREALRRCDPSKEAYVGKRSLKFRSGTGILEAQCLSRSNLSHSDGGRLQVTNIRVKKNISDRFTPNHISARIRALRKHLEIDQTAMADELGVTQATVSGWENDEFPPSPMALMAIGRLDSNNTMWWYEQAGSRFARRLEIQRGIREIKESQRAEREAGVPCQWDAELLTFVIETVDAELKQRRRTLQIGKYAELIALIYEYCHRLGERNPDIVVRLLKIA